MTCGKPSASAATARPRSTPCASRSRPTTSTRTRTSNCSLSAPAPMPRASLRSKPARRRGGVASAVQFDRPQARPENHSAARRLHGNAFRRSGTSQKKTQTNREEVKRVVRAVLQSLDFMARNPVETSRSGRIFAAMESIAVLYLRSGRQVRDEKRLASQKALDNTLLGSPFEGKPVISTNSSIFP